MAALPKLKNLPTDPACSIFRVIDRQLRLDPTLAATVKLWQSWEGVPADKNPPSSGQWPYVQITPRVGPNDWWAASTLIGTEFVHVLLVVEGWCYDDVLNLWGAFQRACYPADPAALYGFQNRLRDAGAHTGVVKFNRPAVTNDPAAEGMIAAEGWIACDYRFNTHPTAPGL